MISTGVKPDLQLARNIQELIEELRRGTLVPACHKLGEYSRKIVKQINSILFLQMAAFSSRLRIGLENEQFLIWNDNNTKKNPERNDQQENDKKKKKKKKKKKRETK